MMTVNGETSLLKNDRLFLAVVGDDEVLLAQVGHQTALAILDGRVDRHELGRGSKWRPVLRLRDAISVATMPADRARAPTAASRRGPRVIAWPGAARGRFSAW
jgi:hypothetical protein